MLRKTWSRLPIVSLTARQVQQNSQHTTSEWSLYNVFLVLKLPADDFNVLFNPSVYSNIEQFLINQSASHIVMCCFERRQQVLSISHGFFAAIQSMALHLLCWLHSLASSVLWWVVFAQPLFTFPSVVHHIAALAAVVLETFWNIWSFFHNLFFCYEYTVKSHDNEPHL